MVELHGYGYQCLSMSPRRFIWAAMITVDSCNRITVHDASALSAATIWLMATNKNFASDSLADMMTVAAHESPNAAAYPSKYYCTKL